MYSKAVMFGDIEIANAILKTSDPKEQKSLGRKVKNFKADIWNEVAREIVFLGNKFKFSQNKFLYNKLMSTKDKILVEASPYDEIWGIGLDEATAKITPESEWPGINWLGLTLIDLREYFKINPVKF